MTLPLERPLRAEERVLTFEYICPQGFDEFCIWLGPPFGYRNRKQLRRIASTEDWTVFSVDLSEELENWGKPGNYLRIDLGDDHGCSNPTRW